MSVLEQVKDKIREALQQALVRIGVTDIQADEIVLEVPREKSHGDFSTNTAMQLARQLKSNPRTIAEQLIQALDKSQAGIREAHIAGPGFINFVVDKSFLAAVISQIAEQGSDYGRTTSGAGQRVQVEFVSANPTGSLHLGHARGAAVGDALCNLLDYAGHTVSREYYINDAGNQVHNLAKSLEARYFQALGQDMEMPEDGYYGEDIIGFARQLVEEQGEGLLALEPQARYEQLKAFGLRLELDKIKRDLARFNVHFDHWFSESSLYSENKIQPVLDELRDKGKTYEEEGALWLDTMPYGDDKNRVLIKQDGSYTYLTPDIAYHRDKFSRGFDRLINIWGADHHGYIPRMKAAMMALGYEADRLQVLIAQMVSLFQDGEKVKMSKRTGKAVTMEDLMDEVGVDAIRYFFTMRSMDAHLDFDMDLAVSKSNENPVFYVQYAHARICSIFRQAQEQDIALQPLSEVDLSLLATEAEVELMQKLAALPAEVDQAAQQYAPHRLVRYVYELAAQLHSYYRAERVIGAEPGLMQARLHLLASVRQVLVNVLKLIGVSAPEQM